MTDAPLIRAAGLWRKESQKGNVYYVGTLGGLKVLILENRDRDRSEADPTHFLCLGERQQKGSQRRPEPRQQAVGPGGSRDARRPAPAPEPAAGFYDDADEAIRDLTGRGR
jgi:hypothetical protein